MDNELIRRQLSALLEKADAPVSALANASAFLFDAMRDVNWLGFYLLRGDTLILGPFQGKPACVSISVNAGVCGAAIRQNATLRVPDVHAFAGHIACDAASNSELVVPLIDGDGAPFGVLDVDSTLFGRFSEQDQALLEDCAAIVSARVAGSIRGLLG